MARRWSFQASKFRNMECHQLPWEQNFHQLQVASDATTLTATKDKFAFPHQMDGGGAIRVKMVSDTGKESHVTPPLIRAHSTKVNALEFSPFDYTLLASVAADATMKLWKLPENGLELDITTPIAAFNDIDASLLGIKFHPAAQDVVVVYGQMDLLIYDLTGERTCFHRQEGDGTFNGSISSLAWNYDGSLLAITSLDNKVQLLDPRVGDRPALTADAHTGKRPSSIVWCGQLEHFITAGSDRMQERELKVWDPRKLARYVHRERLDSGIGQLYPLYDGDINLLYLFGKGDRSVRSFEIDLVRAPFVHGLERTVLANTTLAAAMLPKDACDTSNCEVNRILNLSTSSGGICEVLSYRIPRKDATHTFQSDLYPDTKAEISAISGADWANGLNAPPIMKEVTPSVAPARDTGLDNVFKGGVPQVASSWGTAPATNIAAAPTASSWASGWNTTPSAPPSSSGTTTSASQARSNGWRSTTTVWNAPAVEVPPSKPISWAQVQPPAVSSTISATPSSTSPTVSVDTDVDELSSKAQRLGAKYGHKLKYIKGKQATRNEVFNFGEKQVAYSTIANPIIKANSRFWAAPVIGAGGPVLVNALNATGKATHASPVINGQKMDVLDMDFNPFVDTVLATGSGDCTIQIWSLGENADGTPIAPSEPNYTLSGHRKAIRSVLFHPTASNVLCSSGLDMSLRFWDVEYGKERLFLDGKLEDMAWNMEFNFDGSLLATASRAKIVRIFDPRQQEHALVSMGCGYDSGKPQFVSWIDPSCILTIGVNTRNEKQLSFWDPRNLLEPLSSPMTIETAASNTVHYPFYDPSSKVYFLVGMGDRHVWSYEIDTMTAKAHANLPFVFSGQDTVCGAALLPKSLCNVKDVEVDHMLLLTPNTMEHVSFSLPRTEKLKQFFQDDIYGPIRTSQPSLGAEQWFAGENVAPTMKSLRPTEMIPLSEKPEDTVKARPKTLDFQVRLRKEEEEKRQKAEQFERLNVLAAQPSLHSLHQAKPQDADDSDDDWDD